MEKQVERKVLISVKVSTLLLILIGLIITAVVLVVICKNISQKNEYANVVLLEETKDSEGTSEVVETEKITTDREVPTPTVEQKDIISSRSNVNREEIVGIDLSEVVAEPEVEEVIELTTPIEEVTIAVDMDLTVRTGLSRDDFISLMARVKADTSGFFEENAGLIYDVCEKYSLNEIFFCGLISAESGWDIAGNHRRTYNYISLMSSNGLIRFESVEDGMEKAAKTLHDRYLTPGGSFYYGPTLAAMKTRFCPASSTWVGLVYGRMEQIMSCK